MTSNRENVENFIAQIQNKIKDFDTQLKTYQKKGIHLNFLSRSITYLIKIEKIIKKNYALEKENDVKFHNLYNEQNIRYHKICHDFHLATQLQTLPFGITSVYGEYLDLDDDIRKYLTDFVIFRRNYWMFTFVHPLEKQNINFVESITKKIISIQNFIKFYLVGNGKPPAHI